MKETLVQILRCPACKQQLVWRQSGATQTTAPDGILSCGTCKTEYKVQNGVPRLYIADEATIDHSNQPKHPEYILDEQHLEAKRRQVPTENAQPPQRRLTYSGIPVFTLMGWVMLLAAGAFLVASFIDSRVASGLLSAAAVAFAGSLLCFALDFSLYRQGLNRRHRYQIRRLSELFSAGRLSEYDLQTQEDHEEDAVHANPLEDQTKAAEIARRLTAYEGNQNGKTGLNVGCGGDLHQLVSKPYFDRGYDMVGVDISERYLVQYRKLFGSDAILANALALPFASGTFSLVHYCDILEHVHHPYLGLSEVNRVLKNGGLLVLSTNYRCRLSRECANPLILLERVVSLYYDGVLGPRDMLRGFGNMEFYHLEFSRKELNDLFESAGFEIVEFYTYIYKRVSLTRLFSRLPILRFMGDTLLVTCRKRMDLARS